VDALGRIVAEALTASAANVPTPKLDQRSATTAPLLKIAGVRSWLALQRSAAFCSVRRTGAELVAEPTRNGGASGSERGYHPLSDQSITVRGEHGPRQIGEAVMAALERCR
jgi:hypothetical protein